MNRSHTMQAAVQRYLEEHHWLGFALKSTDGDRSVRQAAPRTGSQSIASSAQRQMSTSGGSHGGRSGSSTTVFAESAKSQPASGPCHSNPPNRP